MKHGIILGLTLLIISTAAVAQVQSCAETTYHCLDPDGKEFFGGVVASIPMWFSEAEQRCIPSPHSKLDGCINTTQACNNAFPKVCRNNCLAGHSVSYTVEESCVGVVPLSTPTTP